LEHHGYVPEIKGNMWNWLYELHINIYLKVFVKLRDTLTKWRKKNDKENELIKETHQLVNKVESKGF
jgi:hypothetical protein